jgi:hypothetical protein
MLLEETLICKNRLCSRAPVVNGQSQPVSYLPFSRRLFQTIALKFQVHRTTTRTIARGMAHFSRSFVPHGDPHKDRIG